MLHLKFFSPVCNLLCDHSEEYLLKDPAMTIINNKNFSHLVQITIANVAVEWFIHVVLLVFCTSYEDDAASIAFSAFHGACKTPSLHRMVIFNTNWDSVLGPCVLKFYNQSMCQK